MIEDFKETFPVALCILSMVVVFGMLTLEVAGFGIFKNPALQTVWYINLGLLFLSYLALGFQAREGEVSEGWETPLKLEPISPHHKAVTRVTTNHSSQASILEKPMSTVGTVPATLEAREGIEQKQALEKPMEAPTLEPPTKEELHKLKEALELKEGSLHYKNRGQGIYHVVYDPTTKKHRWTHIASWPTLKPKLKE